MSYASTDEHVADELARVDSLLMAYARAVGQASEQLAELLERRPRRGRRTAIEPSAETIRERVGATDGATPLRYASVADRFGLDRVEIDALSLALAPDLDERYERAFGILQADETMRRPTVGLAVAILRTVGHDRLDAMAALAPASPPITQGLLDVVERGVDTPFRSRILSVEQRVLSYLLGSTGPESPADGRITRVDPSPSSGFDRNVDERVREAIEANREPTLYVFSGPEGAGQERAARAVSRAAAAPRLRVDAEEVRADPRLLADVIRETRLEGAVLQVSGVDPEREPADRQSIDQLLDEFDVLESDVVLTGTEATTIGEELAHEVVQVEFSRPDHDRRAGVWRAYGSALPASVEPSELASTFALTEGQIHDAITVARNEGVSSEITEASLYAGCKSRSGSHLDELAEQLDPGATWEDIVLPAGTERQLREVGARITQRGRVYGAWGLGEQFTRGRGVVALFAGPSGTGKTMAAEVLANDAGMDLYKIDLSTVVSKYIGETEENLEAIFEAAEHSSSILLFDEADSIFGERSAVSDATDRYANVEVNYLLQRIERYDGVVLLTTNFAQNVDDAFQRRIDLTIDFPRPTKAVRQRLWSEMLSGSVPTDGVDESVLARLELTGGSIKNAVQSAAFLAAGQDSQITMEHLLSAVKREYDKTGQLLDPKTLGEYSEQFAE